MAHCSSLAAGIFLVFLGVSDASSAPDAVAQREIAELMKALQGSHCRFQRNGSWYDDSEARSHLQRKYDQLRRRDLVDSAEQFIERAASRSSVSGKPYRIACPGQAEQNTSDWFAERLRMLRKPSP